MLEQILPMAVASLATWCGWTVVRTAFELRHELAPVRSDDGRRDARREQLARLARRSY